MALDARTVGILVSEHFAKMVDLQNISDIQIKTYGTTKLDSSSAINTLADQYIDNFFRCVFDETHQLVGLKDLKGSKGAKKEFKSRIVIPQLSSAEWLVTSMISFAGDTKTCYSIVLPDAGVGDTTKIIDPFTASYYLAPEHSIERASKRIIRKFNNGFGIQVASYEAYVKVTCAGSVVRACEGWATGQDSTPTMSAHTNYKKSSSNGCCTVDYAFAGTGGWPDVTIKWSAKNSKFEISVGGYGWKYFNEVGSISDCCPISNATSTGAESGNGISIGSTVGSSEELGEEEGLEISCATIFPSLPECSEDDGYDLSWDELLKKVRDGEGLSKNHPLRNERALQNDDGDYPEVGYHFNFYDDKNQGKHVGGGFGVRCCKDTQGGPQTSWKYKWTA